MSADEPAATVSDEDGGYLCDCGCLLCEVGGIRHRHGSEIVEG